MDLLPDTCEETPKGAEIVTTLNDRLLSKKRNLEAQLSDVNAAIDALEANPEVAKLLTLVGKVVNRL